MAGLGRKIFNSGDILLASEVQGFLQDQAVMVFDDSATRATAIGTANFSEGMVTYTKDDDAIQVFDGTSFVPVGSEPGLVHIETRTVSAVSAESFNDVFSSDYDNYKVVFNLALAGSASAAPLITLRVGGVDNTTASSYSSQLLSINGTGVTGERIAAANALAGIFGPTFPNGGVIEFFGPFKSQATAILSTGAGSLNNSFLRVTANTHNQTVSYDGFTMTISAGNVSGLISIYAYAKA